MEANGNNNVQALDDTAFNQQSFKDCTAKSNDIPIDNRHLIDPPESQDRGSENINNNNAELNDNISSPTEKCAKDADEVELVRTESSYTESAKSVISQSESCTDEDTDLLSSHNSISKNGSESVYTGNSSGTECSHSSNRQEETIETLPLSSEATNSLESPVQVNSSNEVVDTTEEDVENASNLSTGELSDDDYSESEENADLDISDLYPLAQKWQFRAVNPDLPETVTVLESLNGGKVYLVGTAHFSLESQEDVAKTIRATQPDVVMVELCKSRINILSLDEETILEESKNMSLQKIHTAIKQNGFMQGVMYLLLLSMSAHLTKQLGMAPGGEFRRAFTEAKKVPGCLVHLGDRPIHITLQRALASLSVWQKVRLAWYMLTSKEPISKEEVERCKQRDLLEEMLAEMTGEFPALSKVFVKERDIYLAYSLSVASAPFPVTPDGNGKVPSVVVGVVGIGHVPGIVSNWGKVNEKDIPAILSVPEASLASKIIRRTVRVTLYGVAAYGCYRLLPSSITSAVSSNLSKVTVLRIFH